MPSRRAVSTSNRPGRSSSTNAYPNASTRCLTGKPATVNPSKPISSCASRSITSRGYPVRPITGRITCWKSAMNPGGPNSSSGASRARMSNVLIIPGSPSQWSRCRWVMKIASRSGRPMLRSN